MFYSLPIVLFFRNSSGKVSGLLFIFFCIVTPTFQMTRCAYPGAYKAQYSVFFGCRKPDRKSSLKVCGWLLCLASIQERNSPSRQSLPVHKCNIQPLLLVYIYKLLSYLKIFPCGCRNINRYTQMHAYIHACIHTHLLKTNFRNLVQKVVWLHNNKFVGHQVLYNLQSWSSTT